MHRLQVILRPAFLLKNALRMMAERWPRSIQTCQLSSEGGRKAHLREVPSEEELSHTGVAARTQAPVRGTHWLYLGIQAEQRYAG
jgi:hypothetical protein